MSIVSPQVMSSEIDIGGMKFSRRSDQRFLYTYYEYNNLKDATNEDRRREFENLKFYTGLNDGQWYDEAVSDIEREGRRVGTYNVAKRKIEGIAGSITRNPFDVKYIGDDANLTDITLKLQQMYLSDKELMDWSAEYYQGLIYGLCTRTCFDMVVDTALPAGPLGNVAIKCRLPGSFIPDQDWKEPSSKSLKLMYVTGYMTGQQMKDIYHISDEKLRYEIQMSKLFGKTYESNERVDWNIDLETMRGSRYLVVEKRYLETKTVSRLIDPGTGTIFWEWMSDDDVRNLAVQLNIPGERLREEKVISRVYKILAICPQLSMVLADYDHPIQIGRIPSFIWAPYHVNGKLLGLLDFLKDAQREVNYRQSTITLGASGAVTAGIGVDAGMFEGPDQVKRFRRNYGNPRQVAEFRRGASRQFPNGIMPLPRVQIPPELFTIVDNMIGLMDYLVPQPTAGEGRTERTGESGVHYQQKLEVMKTMQMPMMMSIKQLWNDIGEAYLYVASQVYSKGMRKFTSADGKEDFTINVPSVDTMTGETYLDNDFSKIATMRHRIQISESPSSVNVRMAQQEYNYGMLSTWPQNLQNTVMPFVRNILKSLQLTDDEKEAANKALERDERLIASDTEARIAQNEAIINQAQAARPPQPAAGPEQITGAPPEAPPPMAGPQEPAILPQQQTA